MLKALDGEHESRLLKKSDASGRNREHNGIQGSPERNRTAAEMSLAVKIGKCIAVRRNFCGLSKQQLGARLGVDPMEVEAYEQGEKRMSCRLLLETARQLKATPRFFFQ
jgi:ribosome-binding protein aMBF1 (putative translation factor)